MILSQANCKRLFFITALVAMSSTQSLAQTSSSKVRSNNFVAGTYTDNGGSTCTLDTSELMEERVEVALSCLDRNGPFLSATWVTGPILGNPFELDLKQYGIDKIPGNANYSWGKISSGGSSNNAFGCFSTNHIISARLVGKTLALTNYGTGNIARCGINLIKKGVTVHG